MMKSTSLGLVIALTLAACSEKPAPEPQAQQPQAAAPAPVDAVPQMPPSSVGRPAEIPATLGTSETCALDAVNGASIIDTATVADKQNIQLSGWAGDLAAGTSPQNVYVQLEGPESIFIKASRGPKRQDVATLFNKPGFVDAGWDANANLAEAAAGTYRAWIIQFDGDTGVSCDTKRSIVIN